jgi:hypothetical protein
MSDDIANAAPISLENEKLRVYVFVRGNYPIHSPKAMFSTTAGDVVIDTGGIRHVVPTGWLAVQVIGHTAPSRSEKPKEARATKWAMPPLSDTKPNEPWTPTGTGEN